MFVYIGEGVWHVGVWSDGVAAKFRFSAHHLSTCIWIRQRRRRTNMLGASPIRVWGRLTITRRVSCRRRRLAAAAAAAAAAARGVVGGLRADAPPRRRSYILGSPLALRGVDVTVADAGVGDPDVNVVRANGAAVERVSDHAPGGVGRGEAVGGDHCVGVGGMRTGAEECEGSRMSG